MQFFLEHPDINLKINLNPLKKKKRKKERKKKRKKKKKKIPQQ